MQQIESFRPSLKQKVTAVGLTAAAIAASYVEQSAISAPKPEIVETANVDLSIEMTVPASIKPAYEVENIDQLAEEAIEDIMLGEPIAVAIDSLYVYWQKAEPNTRQSTVVGIINPVMIPARIAGQERLFVAGVFRDPRDCGVSFTAFHEVNAGDPAAKWDNNSVAVSLVVAANTSPDSEYILETVDSQPLGGVVHLPFGISAETFAETDLSTLLSKTEQFTATAPDC